MSVRAHGDASTSVTTRAKATCSGVVGRPRSSAGRSGALRPALLVRAAAAEVDEGVDEHASHGSTTRRRGALATIHVASCQAAQASLFPAQYLASISVCERERSWRAIPPAARSGRSSGRRPAGCPRFSPRSCETLASAPRFIRSLNQEMAMYPGLRAGVGSLVH